jgi:hypothetical protein
MKAVMTITDSGSWSLELTADTPAEAAMLTAVQRGHGVACTCGGAGSPEVPVLIVTGDKGRV